MTLGERIAKEAAIERKIINRLVIICPCCGSVVKLKELQHHAIKLDSGGDKNNAS